MDKFCKEIGRKISLARALQTFPRDTRKRVWEAYFNRFIPTVEPLDESL